MALNGEQSPRSGADGVVGAVVHIVDDDDAVRETVRLYAEEAGYAVVEHSGAASLLATIDPDDIACIVTDVRMPGMDGLALIDALAERSVTASVIVLTGFGDVPTAVTALKSGAVDFIEKPFQHDAFMESLSRAVQRSRDLAAERQTVAETRARLDRLTSREREVLDLIVDGLANLEIAAQLAISVRTVENHRARVMEKTGARGVSELVRMGLTAKD